MSVSLPNHWRITNDNVHHGNRDHLSVNDDNSNGDTIIVGKGNYDFVSAANSIFDTITLGNGTGDSVSFGDPGPNITGFNNGGRQRQRHDLRRAK